MLCECKIVCKYYVVELKRETIHIEIVGDSLQK